MDNVNNDILYTVKEVAQILKTNVDYVHKLRKANILPFLKIGQYKVLRTSLLSFLSAHEGQDLTNPSDIKELNQND